MGVRDQLSAPGGCGSGSAGCELVIPMQPFLFGSDGGPARLIEFFDRSQRHFSDNLFLAINFCRGGRR